MTPLILAAAILGQSARIVTLGLPGGLDPDLQAYVASAPDDFGLLDPTDLLKAGKIRLQPFGTKAEVLGVVDLKRTVGGEERHEDGYRVKLLDGPDAGLLGYVRSHRTRPDGDGPVVVGQGAETSKAPISPGMSERRRAEMEATMRNRQQQKARSAARAARNEEQRIAQEKEDAKTIAQMQKDYMAALPYLLENQRQQLQRMSDAERNAALMQMAKSNKAIADAITYSAMQRP